MRLWPTTPVLARETIRRDALSGAEVPPRTQVMILNNVLHRDEGISPTANRFRPERWSDGVPPFAYNHMSNGAQGCAGRHLALFIGKAVLAELLRNWTYSEPNPAIDPNGPVPLINNHFEIRFQAARRGP
jgi:cytochrome P450